MISKRAQFEITELSHEAERLARGNAADRAQSAVLVKRITSLERFGVSTDEARGNYVDGLLQEIHGPAHDREARYQKHFETYLATGQDHELRADFAVGSGAEISITYSQGAAGGYLVPLEYRRQIVEAMAQTDPLLDPDVCDFVMEPTPFLRPETLSGWDLSTIAMSQVNEATQQTAGNAPTMSGRTLRSNLIYKISLAASIEADEDIPDFASKLATAYGVAAARKLGADAINGNGTTAPQGLQTALTSSYSTGTAKIVSTDITSIFFSINAWHRAQPKAGWIMGDAVYRRVRDAVDNSGRPLLDFSKDKLQLMSKPVHISPTLGMYIIFGNLDAFHIRCSAPTIAREMQQTIKDITSGEVLYVGRIRMDSAYLDPSAGSVPPITLATVTP